MTPRPHPRSGFVLPAILFGLVVMSVLAVANLRTSGDQATAVRSFRESGLALMAADAGLRRTMGTWPSGVSSLGLGDSLDFGWQALPNRGRYRAVVTEVDNGGPQVYSLVVQGRGAGSVAGQRTVTAMFAAVSLFSSGGIVANGNVNLSGGSKTDSFNSMNGAYNAATADSGGNIVGNGNITLSNSATIVKGSISVRGSISNSQATVTGSLTAGAPPTPLDTLSCPSGGFTPASAVPTGPGISYNATTGVLNLGAVAGNPQTYTLSGTSYYFSSIIVGGGSTLAFTTSAHTDIYIGSTVDIGGGSLVNNSANASRLSILACGNTSSAQWRLTGGTNAYFTVYAPTHDVVISGAGSIYGAIVSKAYTASGGSAIHYDRAVGMMRSPLVKLIPGSWAELGSY
jgi:hypothetical protein